MGQSLYIEREFVPLAEEGKEVMIVFRDHGSASARPVIFISALEPNSAVTVLSGIGANTDGYTNSTVETLAQRGQKARIELPIGGDMNDRVSVVRVDSGAVSVTVVSPTRVQTEFRTRKHP